ncbi:MAG TPA: WecB/TagA/CpsF family glycosyltransferase [Longilinea sp.]|nr:WecB/TagA/CpsF family glycosyltransferase [Longilinea sp.]
MPQSDLNPPISRTNVLGVGVSALNIPLAVDRICSWVEQRSSCQYVCVRDVNGIMESQRDPELRYIHNRAGLVTPDGMPMVWLSRLAGHKEVSRVYGPDLMTAITQVSAERGYRQFYYGGTTGVAELLADKLAQRFPGLVVCGTYTPPFRPLTEQEDQQVIDMINTSKADFVWVGLSTPKQERWMAAHASKLNVPVLLGVGAAFDFLSGTKIQAPRWIQRSGFEWLYRLIQEPRRLGKRYLVNNPLFIWKVFWQVVGLKKYTLDDGREAVRL